MRKKLDSNNLYLSIKETPYSTIYVWTEDVQGASLFPSIEDATQTVKRSGVNVKGNVKFLEVNKMDEYFNRLVCTCGDDCSNKEYCVCSCKKCNY